MTLVACDGSINARQRPCRGRDKPCGGSERRVQLEDGLGFPLHGVFLVGLGMQLKGSLKLQILGQLVLK